LAICFIPSEDKDGIDAYMEAVMEGDIEILEHLMSKGGSLNKIYSGSQNIQDFSVFHFAVLSNRIEMLAYLLDNKHKLGISVDLNYKNRQGDTAGQLASRLTKFEFAKLIFEYGGVTELPLIKNLDGNGVSYDRYYKNANVTYYFQGLMLVR
jgi:ankyrin repeat protein